MRKHEIADWEGLAPDTPTHALVEGVDLVLVRRGDAARVLYGRCPHRGALLADGRVEGDDLVCGVHNWDFRVDTGVSAYNNAERLHVFSSWVEDGKVWVDEDEIAAWAAVAGVPRPIVGGVELTIALHIVR